MMNANYVGTINGSIFNKILQFDLELCYIQYSIDILVGRFPY